MKKCLILFIKHCDFIDVQFYFSTSNQKALHLDCPKTINSSPASPRLLLKVDADVGMITPTLHQLV